MSERYVVRHNGLYADGMRNWVPFKDAFVFEAQEGESYEDVRAAATKHAQSFQGDSLEDRRVASDLGLTFDERDPFGAHRAMINHFLGGRVHEKWFVALPTVPEVVEYETARRQSSN